MEERKPLTSRQIRGVRTCLFLSKLVFRLAALGIVVTLASLAWKPEAFWSLVLADVLALALSFGLSLQADFIGNVPNYSFRDTLEVLDLNWKRGDVILKEIREKYGLPEPQTSLEAKIVAPDPRWLYSCLKDLVRYGWAEEAEHSQSVSPAEVEYKITYEGIRGRNQTEEWFERRRRGGKSGGRMA